MLHTFKSWNPIAAFACVLLSACGGGGGGSDNGGGGGKSNNTDPSVSINTHSVSVSESSWDPGQQTTAVLTVSNMPAAGAYVAISNSFNGLASADFTAQSTTSAQVIFQFKPGTQTQPGTYQDTVTVKICVDSQCAQQFRNSPITITTSLVVSGESSISPDPGLVSASANRRVPSQSSPTASATATVGNPGPVAPYLEITSQSALIQNVARVAESPSRVRIDLTFTAANFLQPGQHSENVTLMACYDSSCARQLAGSPMSIPVTYTVTNDALAEPGVTPLSFLSRISLPHDVIDSEYDRQLDAVVMVASYPRNSLYLFDVSSKTEREVVLSKAPMSVSVSPDGTRAAVGHDALVSIVDLSALATTGATPPVLLNTSTGAFDIVLDGHGFVHVFPLADQWVQVHSIEIATNTETLSSGNSIYDSEHARLHPSGNFIYGANNGLSPSDIEKFDLSGGVASYLYDSPYHGDYGMCGDLWMKDDGSTVYTRCGNSFRSSTTKSQDMVYSGKLELSQSQYYGYAIDSLSQSSATKEIALIESDTYNCASFQSQDNCYTHLAIYESDFLNRQSVSSIAPFAVAGAVYGQRGLFVFHSSDGAHRYLISQLIGMPNPATEYYLTILN